MSDQVPVNCLGDECTTYEKAVHDLRQGVASGMIAVVPVGFRCHTSMHLKKRLGLSQLSLPFDSGFFPPISVSSLLKGPPVDLTALGEGQSHKVCVKLENTLHPRHGRGIRFETSTYEAIDQAVKSPDQPGINKYLDSTFGYYTLDCRHNFVLAHYNWHKFAEKTAGITSHSVNLEAAANLLNKRIERLLAMCEKAARILFVHHEC